VNLPLPSRCETARSADHRPSAAPRSSTRLRAGFAQLSCALLLAAAGGPAVGAEAGPALFDASSPLQIASQGVFYVPGRYVDEKSETIMTGQMFVQYQIPAKRTRPYPIVMIHGGGQTGSNFLGTPDGRPGWADYFLSRGYAVYVVDQSGRGRSGYFTQAYGPTRRPNTSAMSRRFTAPEKAGLWPQAKLHTQWPGAGTQGDAVFDEFFASQVEDMADLAVLEQLNADAGARLLDRIGPAVLLTHSQSGSIGWRIADARPQLTKGIIAVEPSGPPVYDLNAVGPPEWFKDSVMGRPWGITRGPMTYDPPAASESEMRYVQQDQPDGPDLVRCRRQAEPARRLTRLAGLPILMVMSESSYHTPYDHCTSKYLTQAGVRHDFMRLAEKGIKGNGHMMFLEKNNLEIAHLIESWEKAAIR
jgi:pimeloyl-ACP methyl ester carboxylesterase